jgi:hypothetical protein
MNFQTEKKNFQSLFVCMRALGKSNRKAEKLKKNKSTNISNFWQFYPNPW